MGAGSAVLSNSGIAELLALESEKVEGQSRMALKRAARLSFVWPREAAELLQQGLPLTSLSGVGPSIEKRIRRWIEAGVQAPEPPPIRKGFLTAPEAQRILERHRSWQTGYRGDLQTHTTWSDGSGTVHEMAVAALDRGYAYLGITDHSKGLKIAGGINEAYLERQRIEIDAANYDLKGRSFRVLHSIELNINPDGEGDMNPAVLSKLDYVVVSFHSALRRSGDQTSRYIAALENPHVQILGHPRGRIYNHREGLQADWTRVFARAAELDKAVEIDSYPDRQDLNLELLHIARHEGVRIAIDTDAHTPAQLNFIAFGLAAAIKAGITKDRVVNFLCATDLLRWSQSVRARAMRVAKRFVLEST